VHPAGAGVDRREVPPGGLARDSQRASPIAPTVRRCGLAFFLDRVVAAGVKAHGTRHSVTVANRSR